MEKKKNYKSLIIKLLVSSVGIGYLFYVNRGDMASVKASFGEFDFRYAPLIILFIILNYVIGAIRWKALLIFKNSEKVSIPYLIKLYFIGSFFNNFMPSSIGGDVYKFLKLGKKMDSTAHAFTATFMERFTGVVILFLISLLSIPVALSAYIFSGELDLGIVSDLLFSLPIASWNPVVAAGLLSLLSFAAFLISVKLGFIFLEKFSSKFDKLKKLNDAMKEYQNNKKVVGMALLTSVFVQLLSIFTQYFIFIALGAELDVLFAMAVFPVISLISFLPISLNGIGVQDNLYVWIFSVAQIPDALSFSASIFYHLFRLSVSLIGGVLYAFSKDN